MTGAASVAASLLAKYGLKPKALHQTNILDPETSAERMVSKEVTLTLIITIAHAHTHSHLHHHPQVIRVKDAPDMNFMESVRHFT